MGEFWRKDFIFNTNAFFRWQKPPNQLKLYMSVSIYYSPYKSGAMLDKITKACYNIFPFVLDSLRGLLPNHS